MKPNPQLLAFLKSYDERIQNLALDLRKYITKLVPQANELIWDNYNALAMAYSKSENLKDAFCHLAIYAKHINFGFNRGAELSNQTIILNGKGNLIRHIKVTSIESFPAKEIEPMVYEAVGISENLNSVLLHNNKTPKSIVMSVSKKKIRPNV